MPACLAARFSQKLIPNRATSQARQGALTACTPSQVVGGGGLAVSSSTTLQSRRATSLPPGRPLPLRMTCVCSGWMGEGMGSDWVRAKKANKGGRP
jgi:hypothetical protein